MKGSVAWFSASKGFGFLRREDGGEDVFCHWSSINCKGYKKLDPDQRVEFSIIDGPKGKPQADNVVVID